MSSIGTMQTLVQPRLNPPSQPIAIPQGALTPRHDASPRLQVLTALDSSSRRKRPGRLVSASAPEKLLAFDVFSHVQRMEAGQLPAVADLMKEEGWNVDFDNMAVVFGMQPSSYFVAVSLTGRILGHCSALNLDAEVGMLSYVLVSSLHQRQGLGSRLMLEAKRSIAPRTLAFYSVQDVVPFYKHRRYSTCRFSALVRDFSLHPEDFSHLPPCPGIKVVKARDVDFELLNSYDSGVQGGPRPRYLKQWILRESSLALAALDAKSGEVLGYISLTLFNGRWDVNPLYADNDDVAMRLLARAAREVGEPVRVFVRVPSDSSCAIKLFSKLRGIQHHRVLYLMSDNPLPHPSSHRVYSLSTVCYGLK